MDVFILALALFCNLFLGLFVLLRNANSSTNRLFFLLNCDIVAWSVANFFSIHIPPGTDVLFWMRLVMFFAVPQSVLFFLLMITFPNTKMVLKVRYRIGLLILSLATMGIAVSPLLFTHVVNENGVPTPVPGPGMIAFVIVAIGSLVAGSSTLIKNYFISTGIRKKQYQFMLIGLGSMFFLIVFFNFILVLFFNNLKFISVSPLYSLPFVVAVGYTIIKHKFLDINVVIVRAVVYSILILCVALFYVLLFFAGGLVFFDVAITSQQLPFIIVVTVVIALSFEYLRKFIQKSTNRFLFKDSYNIDEAIGNLTKIMASTLLLDDLIHKMLPELGSILKFSSAAFLIVQKNNSFEVRGEGNDLIQLSDDMLQKIRSINSLVVFDGLEEGEMKQLLREKNIAVISPCRTQNELIAFLCLGTKSTGENYTEQDIAFIRILSDEAAVAIKNAEAYEEIKRFNVTLQEEVDKATKDLKDANVRLQDLDKLKDEFVSLASHELRTPMAAIKGSLSTILEGYAGEITEQAREFLSAAYNENDRLIRLVNNLLNTSRIEAGKLSFTVTRIDLATLITEVVRNLQPAATEKNLYLRYEPSGLLPHVMADDDKIKEVIINLIGNATKFTATGGITIQSKLDGDFVVTSVADTGTGIHKEHFEMLFKKFSQVKTDYTKQYGGTGLGLYLSKKIVEGLGGKIWLESEVGKGTTFYFSLPIAK